ncbi:MAG: DMT family transporter [Ruminococcaceae bacterium]|nr:DMT family transporter [Oscillospiraceae bacterium]
MLYLLLAVLSSSMISIIMRLSSGKIKANLSMLATNYFICSLLGAAYAGFDLAMPHIAGFSVILWLGIISGVLYLAGFVFFQANTNKHGVVLSSVFMKLGLLVPILASVLFFKEVPTVVQIAGFCIAIFAILLINRREGKTEKSFGFGLILSLLLSGGADVMAKFFDVFAPESLSSLYLFYTFGTAFVLCMVLVIRKKERPGFKELLFGTLIGVPNFFSAKFLVASLAELPGVVIYPTFSVGTLLIVTLAGVIVFGERLRRVQWIALSAIIVALILLNI